MTESQKQFEEWAKENLGCDLSHNGDHYNHTWAYYAWKGWQASTAAIVVKLPEYEPNDHHRNIIIDEVKTTLDAAGVRYE